MLKTNGEKYETTFTQYIVTTYGKTFTGKTKHGKENQPQKELLFTFFHLVDPLYFFKLVFKRLSQLVFESIPRWRKFPQSGKRLSEKINQTDNFAPGKETQCLRLVFKWNKVPATR